MNDKNGKPMQDIRPPSGPLKLKKLDNLPAPEPILEPEQHKEPEHHEHREHHRPTPHLKEPPERKVRIEDFFREREAMPPSRTRPAEPKAPVVRIERWKPKGPKSWRPWLIGGAAILLAGGAFTLLSTVFARADILITPVAETRDLRAPVTVTPDAKSVDTAKRLIPGEMIEFTESHSVSIPASGKKYVSSRASGTITITNSYSNQAQILIANTRFESREGKIFRLEKAVTVPAAGTKNGALVPASIDAKVVADQPGEAYNISPSTFRIVAFKGTPRYSGFIGASDTAFSGGFQGEARVANDDDVRRGTEKVTAELFAKLRDDLGGKVPEGFLIIDGAREIAISGVEVGRAASGEMLPVTATGKVRAMAYRASDEADFISQLFSTDLPRSLVSSQSSIQRQGVSFDGRARTLTMTLAGSAFLERRLDTTALTDAVQGKRETELNKAFSDLGGIESFELKLFPFWLSGVPAERAKIKIGITDRS